MPFCGYQALGGFYSLRGSGVSRVGLGLGLVRVLLSGSGLSGVGLGLGLVLVLLSGVGCL